MENPKENSHDSHESHDKDLTLVLRKTARKDKYSKFKENSMNNIVKVGSAVGNNRFLVAVRDAFMLPFTLTTGAAIPLILSNLFFANNSVISGFIRQAKGQDWTSEGLIWVDKLIGVPMADVFWAVMAGFSIYLAVGMGYFLAKSYGKDGIIAAALSVAIFMAMKPLEGINQTIISGPNAGETSKLATNYLGNSGMLVALLTSMFGTWMYCKLMDVKWLVPKMPESVPPMVAKAFGAIFVAGIVLTTFAFINTFWYVLATELDIRGNITASSADAEGKITSVEYSRQLSTWFIAIEFGLAKPLMGLSGNIGATIIISFLVAFFWFFGIHGTNILTPVTAIIWDANVLRNTAYYAEWKTGKYGTDYWHDIINVSGVDQAGLLPIPMAGLGYIGGTGATLGFLIGILIFSKSKVHRDIAKLSIVPGIFGINEPVNFGVPIVLNPVYFIPYVFGFVLTYTMGHVWILIHWIRPGVVWTPTMPLGLNILFATDFDWWSLLVTVIQVGLAFLIWFPFVFIGPKYQEKVEEKLRQKRELEKQERLAAKAAKLAAQQAAQEAATLELADKQKAEAEESEVKA